MVKEGGGAGRTQGAEDEAQEEAAGHGRVAAAGRGAGASRRAAQPTWQHRRPSAPGAGRPRPCQLGHAHAGRRPIGTLFCSPIRPTLTQWRAGRGCRTRGAPHLAASRPQPHLHHGLGPRRSSRAAAHARPRRGREAAGGRSGPPQPRAASRDTASAPDHMAGAGLKGAGTPPAALTTTWSAPLPPPPALLALPQHSTRRTAVQRKATLFRLHSPAGHFQRIPVQGGAQSQSLALSSLLLQEKAERGRCGRRKKPHPTLIKTGPLPLPALRGGSGQQKWAVCAPLLPELSCHIL